MSDLTERQFAAVLASLAKQITDPESALPTQQILAELSAISKLDQQALSDWLQQQARIMTGAASAALNASQFEEGLAKQEGISDAHKQVWVLFWKEKEPDIHRAMVNKSRWNDSLQSHSWRIDVQTRSKAQAQLSKPVAIVELLIGQSEKTAKAIQFEMDSAQVRSALAELSKIDQVVHRLA